jgi:hypothetical protein
METELFGVVSKKDVSRILKDTLGMTKYKTSRGGRTILIYKPNMHKLARAVKKYLGPLVNSQIPNIPNPLEEGVSENRLERLPEADFSGVS